MRPRHQAVPPAPVGPPDLDEDFQAGLDPRWWVPHYLPHWTTPDRSAARYRLIAGGIELRIEEDQLDWRPEDAPMRVSNLQTGSYAGQLGSPRGTHRHRDDGLVVRTETPTTLLWTPTQGRVDITVSASRDEGCMLAAWLVGTEHGSAEDSGEICVFEIDAEAVGRTTVARSGLKAHHDPRLTTDMAVVHLPFDAGAAHTWTAIWGDGGTLIGCDGLVVRRVPQAPNYPLVLMIDLFEVGPRCGQYPKTAVIHLVRGWSRRTRQVAQ